MDTDAADIDLIERYMTGKLSDAEVRMFEYRLGDDREFARKYRLRKTFPSLMNEAGAQEQEKAIAGIHFPEPNPRPRRLVEPRILTWAAILIVLIGILVFFIVRWTSGPGNSLADLPNPAVNNLPEIPAVQQEINTSGSITGKSSQKAIELENPADGMRFKRSDEILFQWTQRTDSLTNFYIYSEINDRLVFWRGIKPGVREYKVPAINFLPGRFYWYVGTKEIRRTLIITE